MLDIKRATTQPMKDLAYAGFMPIVTSLDEVKRILREHRTVAVLGAHPKESKAANYVPTYLQEQGYDLYPVNPVYAGQSLFGKIVAPSLRGLQHPIEIVDVFRRSEALPEHLDDILAMEPLPKVVWFQSGIYNDEVARLLAEAGIEVVQNRCMLADHQRLLNSSARAGGES